MHPTAARGAAVPSGRTGLRLLTRATYPHVVRQVGGHMWRPYTTGPLATIVQVPTVSRMGACGALTPRDRLRRHSLATATHEARDETPPMVPPTPWTAGFGT